MESSQILEDYLLQCEKNPLISKEEELALIKSVQEKGVDCQEMRKLESVHLSYITSLAETFHDKGISLADLIQAGNRGLGKAALKYQLNGDFFVFISYASWWIKQEMKEAD